MVSADTRDLEHLGYRGGKTRKNLQISQTFLAFEYNCLFSMKISQRFSEWWER